MSTRLATGGRFTDRGKQIGFTFNGRRFTGFQGDTLASALLAGDHMKAPRLGKVMVWRP